MDDETDDRSDGLLPGLADKLSPEEALRGFMEVDPEKVKERLEERDKQGGDE